METTGRERGIEGRRNWRKERKDRGTCELENGAKGQRGFGTGERREGTERGVTARRREEI